MTTHNSDRRPPAPSSWDTNQSPFKQARPAQEERLQGLTWVPPKEMTCTDHLTTDVCGGPAPPALPPVTLSRQPCTDTTPSRASRGPLTTLEGNSLCKKKTKLSTSPGRELSRLREQQKFREQSTAVNWKTQVEP